MFTSKAKSIPIEWCIERCSTILDLQKKDLQLSITSLFSKSISEKKFCKTNTRFSELGYEVRLRGPVLREPGLQLGALSIKVLLHKLGIGKMKHISNQKFLN
jgi:hypothetical protein